LLAAQDICDTAIQSIIIQQDNYIVVELQNVAGVAANLPLVATYSI
jgi:hypothetical protein